MDAYQKGRLLELLIWGRRVGALAVSDSGVGVFQYDQDWLTTPSAPVAPLAMKASKDKYSFPDLAAGEYYNLPPMFKEWIPNGFARRVFDSRSELFQLNPVAQLQRLGSMGGQAVSFQANGLEESVEDVVFDLNTLVDEARHIASRYHHHDNASPHQSLWRLFAFLPGEQPKAFVHGSASGERFASVCSDSGFAESLVAKFEWHPGQARAEMAYLRMARDCQISVPVTTMREEARGVILLQRRFDSAGEGGRCFTQSVAALKGVAFTDKSASYENLFALIRRLRLSRQEAIEVYRRMVFNIVANNRNDHFGKWLCLLGEGESQWRLAPMVGCNNAAVFQSPSNKLPLSVNGKREGVTRADLKVLAGLISRFDSEADKIIDQVIDTVSMWPRYARNTGIPSDIAEQIRLSHRVIMSQ